MHICPSERVTPTWEIYYMPKPLTMYFNYIVANHLDFLFLFELFVCNYAVTLMVKVEVFDNLLNKSYFELEKFKWQPY